MRPREVPSNMAKMMKNFISRRSLSLSNTYFKLETDWTAPYLLWNGVLWCQLSRDGQIITISDSASNQHMYNCTVIVFSKGWLDWKKATWVLLWSISLGNMKIIYLIEIFNSNDSNKELQGMKRSTKNPASQTWIKTIYIFRFALIYCMLLSWIMIIIFENFHFLPRNPLSLKILGDLQSTNSSDHSDEVAVRWSNHIRDQINNWCPDWRCWCQDGWNPPKYRNLHICRNLLHSL